MTGLAVEEAERLLQEQDLTADIQYVVDQEKEEGLVLNQNTAAGMMVDKFSQITIEVCSHGSVVPDFTGMTLAEAEALAAESQLTLNVTQVWGQEGMVISQDIEVDSVVDLGSGVAINVGMSQADFTNQLVTLINQRRQGAGMGGLSVNSAWNNAAQALANSGRTSADSRDGKYDFSWALPPQTASYRYTFWATRDGLTTPENMVAKLPFNNTAFLDSGMRVMGIGYAGNRISILIAYN